MVVSMPLALFFAFLCYFFKFFYTTIPQTIHRLKEIKWEVKKKTQKVSRGFAKNFDRIYARIFTSVLIIRVAISRVLENSWTNHKRSKILTNFLSVFSLRLNYSHLMSIAYWFRTFKLFLFIIVTVSELKVC